MRRVVERLVAGQEVNGSNPFAPTILFPTQINALRCVLNCDFYVIFVDNADNIRGFCLEVPSPAQLFPLVPSETPDLLLNQWVRIGRVVPNF